MTENYLKIQPFKSQGIFIKMRGDKYILVGNTREKQTLMLKRGFKFDPKIRAWLIPPVPKDDSIYKSIGALLGEPVDMRAYSSLLKPHKQRILAPMRRDRSVEATFKQSMLKALSDIKNLSISRLEKIYPELKKTNFATKIMSEFAEIKTTKDLSRIGEIISKQVGGKAERVNRTRFISRLNVAMGVDMSKQIQKKGIQRIVNQKIAENQQLITSIPESMLDRMQRTVLTNWKEGGRWEDIIPNLSKDYELSKGRAMLIARTETAKLNSMLTEARSREVGVTQYVWRSVLDNRTRESHADMEGQVVDYDNPPTLDDMTGHAGEFPNCFEPSTKITLTDSCEKLYRRVYNGMLIKIFLADGVSLEATPNHPVLTQKGWLPINRLQKGDYLIKLIPKSGLVNKLNMDILEPRFDDFYNAWSILSHKKVIRGSKLNFHGDGTENDVNIITPNSFLTNNFVAFLNKCLRKFILSYPDFSFDKTFFDMTSANTFLDSIMSFTNKTHSFRFGSMSHSNKHTFRTVAMINPMVIQSFINCESVNSKFLRESFDTHSLIEKFYNFFIGKFYLINFPTMFDYQSPSAEILAKNVRTAPEFNRGIFDGMPFDYEFVSIINKTFREFSGHVYNLQSKNGWYLANNYISKNCRCWQEPLVLKESEDPILDDPETPDDDEDSRTESGGIGIESASALRKISVD